MKLIVVPTPIGNLEDITLRAINALRTCDIVLAEDTRTSGFLLKHLEITKPLYSFHAFNEHQTVEKWLQKLQEGAVIALVSDAGTPGISDPGFLMIRACVQANIPVECLPGATAFVPALVKSGLPCDRFVFEGFLPKKKGKHTLLTQLAEETRTMIFYESPFRVLGTLEDFLKYFGERKVSVSRELTKHFEETINGTLSELVAHFTKKTAKGEFVIVVEGKN